MTALLLGAAIREAFRAFLRKGQCQRERNCGVSRHFLCVVCSQRMLFVHSGCCDVGTSKLSIEALSQDLRSYLRQRPILLLCVLPLCCGCRACWWILEHARASSFVRTFECHHVRRLQFFSGTTRDVMENSYYGTLQYDRLPF